MTVRSLTLTFVTAAAVFAGGCGSLPSAETRSEDMLGDRSAASEQSEAEADGQEAAGDAGDRFGDGAVGSERKPIEAKYKGTGEFIDRRAAQPDGQGPPAAGEHTLNFEGAQIQEVVRAILGEILRENYVIAPGVKGQVTFSTAKPVSRSELMPILEMVLGWNNAAVIRSGGRYKVMPIQQAVPGNLPPKVGEVDLQGGYEVRIFPLDYIAPSQMETILKPFAAQNAILRVDDKRNLIVMAGTAQQLRNYRETIETFDVDWLEGMSVGIFTVERVKIETLVEELRSVFGGEQDSPLAGMFRFMPMERLNAVLVITPQPQYLDQAQEWVKRLDRGEGGAGQRLYVYNVKNVKATDLADTLNQVFQDGGGSGDGARGARGPSGSVGPGLTPAEVSSGGSNGGNGGSGAQPQTGGNGGDAGAQASGGGGNGGNGGATPAATRQASAQAAGARAQQGLALVESEDINITPVEANNALLIRATPQQYQTVLGAIERLDRVPLQVHIEAKIISVSLTGSLQYGVQWFFENAVGDVPRAGGGGNGGDGGASALKGVFDNFSGDSGVINSTQGLNYTFIGDNASAFVNFLQSHTDSTVISAPSLVVLNNKEASINVGEQIPTTTASVNTNVGGDVPTQSVQFRDTGTQLTVTPRVNPGGLVFMEVEQEKSEQTGSSGGGLNNPIITQRTISSEIAVQSGETVLLGGLIDDTKDQSQAGLPFFSQIPVLGGLFGAQSRSHDRSELIVLISPTVIDSADKAREVTEEYKAQFKGLTPLEADAGDDAAGEGAGDD